MCRSDNEHPMQVRVETYVDEGGAEKLRRIRLDGKVVEVADNIDRWYGADYRYVKVRGSDGNTYILRLDEIRAEWELTMYQRSQPQGAAAILHPSAHWEGGHESRQSCARRLGS